MTFRSRSRSKPPFVVQLFNLLRCHPSGLSYQNTIWLNFPENCMKTKKFWPEEGGGSPLATVNVASPMDLSWNLNENNFVFQL